jgi:beta-lactamase regulating signal transducer with metallopeptidase domain
MNIAAILLPEKIVNALGWTLFHALWQGALAALGFAVVLYFSKSCRARVRYGLGLATLALILVMATLTFRSHYVLNGPLVHTSAISPAANILGPAQPATASGQGAPGERSRSERIVSFFSDYFSRHLPLIVTLWLLGVLFLTLRFSGGLLYIQRLKYQQNRPLPQLWQERLQELGRRAGLRRPLLMFESLRLKTPVVIGHLKPMLLLPVGLVTGLPSDEVEALLAHELAHVMRRDYLVNVLQHLVDICFFFHPGIRWISVCVRQEREHCCDDFAVTLCGDPQPYARALARLQTGDNAYTEPALAAAGRGHKLFRRIARLLGQPRLAHDFRAGFISALLLLFCLFGTLKMVAVTAGSVPAGGTASVGSADVSAPAAKSATPEQPVVAKSPVKSRFSLFSFDLLTDGPLKLSGKIPPGLEAPAGTWIVDNSDGRVVWYMALAVRAKQGGGEALFSDEVFLERGSYGWYTPTGCAAKVELNGAIALRNSLESKEARLIEQEKLQREEQVRLAAKRAMKDDEKRKYEEEMLMQAAEAEREMIEKDRLEYEQQRRAQAEEERLRQEELNFKKILAELVAAGLISEGDSYEIKLSAGALTINGKNQPPAVHEKIRKSYEALTGKKLDAKRAVTIVNDKD